MFLIPPRFSFLLLPTPHHFPYFQPTFLPSDQGEIWNSFSCWVKIFPDVFSLGFPLTQVCLGGPHSRCVDILTFFLSAVTPGPSSGEPGVAGFVLFRGGASAPSSHPELFPLLSSILFPIK